MRFFVTAAKGTEGALKSELRAIGVRSLRGDRGGAHFEGDLGAGMRVCLWSRIGMRVLLHLASAEAVGEEGLYDAVKSVPWEDHLPVRGTFAVDASVRSSQLTHSHYVALRTKDAIVDRLREKVGSRPDVDTHRPDVQIALHLARDVAEIYLDLSGEPLHRRGWRVEGGDAPLRETLAAAILDIAGVDPAQPLCDPMCGSGTIAIEAALRARRIAPGRGRHFGFQRWPTFDDAARETFRLLQEEARTLALPKAPEIVARDRFADPLELARRNAQRAGVLGDIVFDRRDARDLAPLPARCQLVFNPPYGERIGGKRLQMLGLFRGIGESWAALGPGHPLAILAGSPLVAEALPGKPRLRHPLFNGPIEAELLVYAG
jgi:23S rRNA G2445 N2-methylase RlmL